MNVISKPMLKISLIAAVVGLANVSYAQPGEDITIKENQEVSLPASPPSMVVLPEPQSTTVMTKSEQEALTPAQVLQRLKDGNQRFVTGQMRNRNLLMQANKTAAAQHPKAVILNCMDSRTAPEIAFDQGIGDIFAIRIAGNIVNDDILGSMEFGTQLSGAKMIAVIGHTSCGAMRGACQQAKLGHLTTVLDKIQPAVKQAAEESKSKDCMNANYIDQIAKDNVFLVIKQIKEQSPVIKKLIDEGKIGIVGGIQDLTSGKVTFFEEQT